MNTHVFRFGSKADVCKVLDRLVLRLRGHGQVGQVANGRGSASNASAWTQEQVWGERQKASRTFIVLSE